MENGGVRILASVTGNFFQHLFIFKIQYKMSIICCMYFRKKSTCNIVSAGFLNVQDADNCLKSLLFY
eukprot:c476_g1_i1 orf=79-279(-)